MSHRLPSSSSSSSSLARGAELSPKAAKLAALGETRLLRIALRRRRAKTLAHTLALGGALVAAPLYLMALRALPRAGFEGDTLALCSMGIALLLILPMMIAGCVLDALEPPLKPLSESDERLQAEAARLAKTHPEARRVVSLAKAQGRSLRGFDLDEMRAAQARKEARRAARDFARLIDASPPAELLESESDPISARASSAVARRAP